MKLNFKNFLKNLICLSLLSPLILKAQDLKLSDDFTVTQAQIDELYKLLPRTTEERTFYHWTSKSTALRWVTQKHINDGEMNFLNTPTGDKQLYGPGFYIAESSTSSQSFGEAPVSLKIKKNSLLFDEEIISKVLGHTLSNDEASILGQRIPFVRHGTSDWYVLNSAQFTRDIFYGAYSSPDAKVYIQNPENWKPFAFANDFRDLINNGDQDAVYLKRILVASDYMDGISFARAMKVNPGAPWTEFEPENFFKYEHVLDNVSKDMEIIKEKGSKDIKEAILDVYNRMAESSHSDLEKAIRSEGIMAGGDEKGKTFLATEKDLKILQTNPYLEVQFTPDGTGKYLVNYYYPDVFHFKKLKGIISPKLFEVLLEMSPEELMNNHELRKKLNKKLISELVEDFSEKMKDGKANWKDLISIHPFDDKNGRTIRMLQKIFQPEVSHIALGDLDLTLPVEEQHIHWASNTTAHQNLQKTFIEEFLKAKTERRMPDYMNTGALELYANEVFPMPVKIDLNSINDLEQIRKRQWVNLLDEGRPAGMDELVKNLNNIETNKGAILRLYNVTKPSVIDFYTQEERLKLLSILSDQIHNSQVILNNRVVIFRNYENAVINSNLNADMAAYSATKEELIKEVIQKYLTAMPGIDESAYLNLLHSLEKDHFKVINVYFDLYAKKSNSHIKSLIGALTKELLKTLSQVGIDEKKKLYNNLKEILKKMTAIPFEWYEMEAIISNYEQVYKSLALNDHPGIPRPSQLKKEIMAWGSQNPGKNNCVLDLLRDVFEE